MSDFRNRMMSDICHLFSDIYSPVPLWLHTFSARDLRQVG